MKKRLLILFGTILIVSLIIFLITPKSQKPNQTVPIEPSPTISTIETPNDQVYNQAVTSVVEKYPWYPQIPIETKDYRIIYDFEKNSFRIRLLTQSTEDLKQSALTKLKNIGVDLAKFNYYFIEP
jgi:hypothetical protein